MRGDWGRGAFFGIVISENVYILYLFPIKFVPQFYPCPPKKIMLSSPMPTVETDSVEMT
jgi:hypothetical protein